MQHHGRVKFPKLSIIITMTTTTTMRMRRKSARGSPQGVLLDCFFSLLLWVSWLALPFAESAAIGGEDGVCNLFAFVPFTIEYVTFCHIVVPVPSLSSSSSSSSSRVETTSGFRESLAAVLVRESLELSTSYSILDSHAFAISSLLPYI
jgi:hypothetical protein